MAEPSADIDFGSITYEEAISLCGGKLPVERALDRCFSAEFPFLSRCEPDPTTDEGVTEAVREFAVGFEGARGDGAGLVLYGPPSTGKTFLAGWAANMLIGAGWRGAMASESAIVAAARGKDGLSGVMGRLSNLDFVIVDDLFRSGDHRTMGAVVDRLYNMRISAVFTTNAGMADLMDPPDRLVPIVDRIAERCRPIEVAGRNWRREMAAGWGSAPASRREAI